MQREKTRIISSGIIKSTLFFLPIHPPSFCKPFSTCFVLNLSERYALMHYPPLTVISVTQPWGVRQKKSKGLVSVSHKEIRAIEVNLFMKSGALKCHIIINNSCWHLMTKSFSALSLSMIKKRRRRRKNTVTFFENGNASEAARLWARRWPSVCLHNRREIFSSRNITVGKDSSAAF